ncbi:MAG: ATP-binding cassette domain-containing protein [Deltaproteobacteria bacterium]|nr:MAG: ATP-binding cassette domain-containing protein [Deltaproteobacteria bacterium]
MSGPLVVVEGLSIRAPGRMLIEDVGLAVHPRRVTALVGPSGAGKSLTARACMAVLDVDPGIVAGSLRYPQLDRDRDWFADVVGKGMRAQRRLLRRTRHLRGAYVTYSPQAASSALNPGRTVGRQLQLAVRRRQEPPASEGRAIAELLDEVGLSPDTAAALPGELSGGMAQRAALAIAIAPLPRMVIADEPETGLDPVLRRAVIELLVEVTRSHGAGLLLISHHESTVDRIADEVVRLPGAPAARGAA